MEKKDSLLMLKYMISEGFNPNNYERILELLQSAPNSISKDLVKNSNPYLLSRKVIYNELDDYSLDGAFGYLEDGEILVPKTITNDNRFLYSTKRLFPKYSYGTPFINEFGTIIFYYNGSLRNFDVNNAVSNSSLIENPDKYFGFILEKDNDKEVKQIEIRLLNEYFSVINTSSSKEYELVHETISEKNKELYLIKKKK